MRDGESGFLLYCIEGAGRSGVTCSLGRGGRGWIEKWFHVTGTWRWSEENKKIITSVMFDPSHKCTLCREDTT